MKQYRMLIYASAFFALTAAGCAGTPETAEEAEPAVGLEEAAAPASERPRLATPVRGVAQLGYTAPVVKNGRIDGEDFVITTMQVKNLEDGSIAGLLVDEFWYDTAGNAITGANYRHPGALPAGRSGHHYAGDTARPTDGPKPVQLHPRERRHRGHATGGAPGIALRISVRPGRCWASPSRLARHS